MSDAGAPPDSRWRRPGGFELGGQAGGGQALSGAGAQIPPVQLRRPDRPGGHGPHRLECVRDRTHSAGLDPDRRPRRRQDHHGADSRPRAELREARRLGEGADHPHADLGVHCQAIMESRHMDVLEMDAASHTGVDDVRQINDSVRYAPASARYKVYIIDEVHMLSTAAFNAFLKTLEEPPRARQVRVRHHRNPQSPGHGAVALPAFRPAPGRGRRADGASRQHRDEGRRRGRARGARHHRARRGRLGARLAVAVRPGDRACGGHRPRRRRAADAGACRPHPRHRSVRAPGARRHRRRLRRIPRAIRRRRRSGRGAVRSRRVRQFRHPA